MTVAAISPQQLRSLVEDKWQRDQEAPGGWAACYYGLVWAPPRWNSTSAKPPSSGPIRSLGSP